MRDAMVAPGVQLRANLESWGVVGLIGIPGSSSIKAAMIVGYFVWRVIHSRVQVKSLLISGLIVIALGGWLALALSQGVEPADSLDQAARVGIFFIILACAQYMRLSFAATAELDRLCRRTAFTAAATKVLIAYAVVVLNIPFQTIQDTLGFESVTQPIGFDIQRLQFPSDFIITFLVACYVGRRSKAVDALFSASVLIVVMLSFSRFIFACFAIGLLVRWLWLAKLDFMPKLVLVFAVALSILFAESLVERFSGESAELSDDIRVEQAEVLKAEIDLRPAFGHGLGASVPGYYRSESQRYSYEMQWYATVMQVGIIGTAALGFGVAVLGLRHARSRRAALCVLILTLVWVAAGFTNPFLTTLGSAIGLAMLGWRCQFRPSPRRHRDDRDGWANTLPGVQKSPVPS